MFIGAGKLSRDNLPEDRVKILDNIMSSIDIIRKEASQIKLKDEDKNISKSKPTNFISILGERGSGKTSLGLTVLEELNRMKCDYCGSNLGKKRKCEHCESDLIEEKALNCVLNIIDPSMFNVEKNALGWIIYLFEKKVAELKSGVKDLGYCGDDEKIKKLEKAYDEVKSDYIKSRPFYRENLSALSEGIHEYDKVNESIMRSEVLLSDRFRKFINKYIEILKSLKNSSKDEKGNTMEPLIFITFDDIDLSPHYGPEILDTVLNYLKHPNIVVFILGSYKTFKEALTIDLWNKENIPSQFDKGTFINNNSLIDEISIRADDILAKVLPAQFRYCLEGLNLIDRLRFTPYGDKEQDRLFKLFESIKINRLKIEKEEVEGEVKEVIKEVNISNFIVDWFIEPIINVESLFQETKKVYEKLMSKADPRIYAGFEGDKYKLELYNNKTKFEKKEIDKDVFNYINVEENNYIYEINPYSYILGETPRSLINLYYDLKNKNKEIRLIHIKSVASIKGYEKLDKYFKQNFDCIYELYESIVKTNLEMNYNKDKFKIEDLVRFDKERRKAYFDFRNLKIEANKIYRYANNNTSQELLNIIYKYELKNEKEKNKEIKNEYLNKENIYLNNAQSAFIQLFYDLCKEFLNDNHIHVKGSLNLDNIPVYKRKEDNIKVTTMNFKYFNHYYIFQKLHELGLPIILEDRKVHRDIRRRLKTYFVDILEYLEQISRDKFNNIFMNKTGEIDLDYTKYVDDAEYNEYKINIIDFIINHKETNNMYEKVFEKHIISDDITYIYNNLISNISNSSSRRTRIDDMKKIIDENEILRNNKSIIDLNELLEKEKSRKTEKETKAEKDAWESIKLQLFKINCIYVARIAKSICYDETMEYKDEIEEITKLLSIFFKQKNRIKISARKYRKEYETLFEDTELIIKRTIFNIRNIYNNMDYLENYIKNEETKNIE